MTIKQQLIQEIESTSESLLVETLNFLRFLKTKQIKGQSEITESTQPNGSQETPPENSQLPYRPASGRSILRHAGTWAGDDYEECLQLVYATRGKANFAYDNSFDDVSA
ncbi:DUF2281 domain-containing protein [Iningainema tapete]|uniref:DUF2281 domain-containing protein n=1 Tax=Iningainema tapete BLCC-T55 TaxID=2748662 RepID=A0A8J6XCQ4_9CYAN|nr:DUF2281 domain-containing protein [Iningainema tapete]MBD2770693.1 DUF2281 domain-containing protein [Iningainema tapete BLCC-T55]